MHGVLFWLILLARLHGHAIFGVEHVSDTVRVRLAWFRCPASVFFFSLLRHGFEWLRRGSNSQQRKKKKEKSQMSDLSPLPTAAALRRSPELDWADRRAAPLSFFFFCFFFFALSPRCLLLLLRLLLRFLSLFRSF